MRFAKSALGIVAIGLGLGIATAPASAEQMASLSSCLSLADHVKAALDANMQSANYHAAQQERTYGREFCTNGFYAKGIAHYEHALQLLGVPEKS